MSLDHLQVPGFYGIHCLTTNKTFISHANDLFDTLDIDYHEVFHKKFEGSDTLVSDVANGIVKKDDRVSSKIFTQTLLFISWYTLRWNLINNVDRYVQMLNVKLKK